MGRQRKVSAAGGRLTEKDQAWSEGWKRDFFRNLAWSPVTVHFSTPGGFLSDCCQRPGVSPGAVADAGALGCEQIGAWPHGSCIRIVSRRSIAGYGKEHGWIASVPFSFGEEHRMVQSI